MYKGKNILGLIPARGGSKSIPRKNIKLFLGKPLIAWSIEQAQECNCLDKIIVSTDDCEISKISKRYGAEIPFLRPKELATDKSLVIDAIRYTVEKLEFYGFLIDIIVILEPTAPTRRTSDIKKSIDILIEKNADCVATFSEMDISPNRIWKIHDNKVEPYIEKANPWLPRQKQPKGYRLNGHIYTMKKELLFKNNVINWRLMGKLFPLITPKERTIDIDTNMDFLIAEKIMENFITIKRKEEIK
jgi:CMP-N-acetylneuraminic acid synthetase